MPSSTFRAVACSLLARLPSLTSHAMAIITCLFVEAAPVYADDYTPSPIALQRMNRDAAARYLTQMLVRTCPTSGQTPGLYGAGISGDVRAIKIDRRSIEFVTTGGNKSFSLSTLEVRARYGSFARAGMVRINLSYEWLCRQSDETIRTIADAFYVLRHSAPASKLAMDDEQFSEVVRKYREANPKPDFPEDARRLRVQAEGALRDKDFEDAAKLYESALALVPWWPEGYFNRALLLGEMGDFELAMASMKRYLLLVPEAANARDAQDKVYEWERKARK